MTFTAVNLPFARQRLFGQNDFGLPGFTAPTKDRHELAGAVQRRDLVGHERVDQRHSLAHSDLAFGVFVERHVLEFLDEGDRSTKDASTARHDFAQLFDAQCVLNMKVAAPRTSKAAEMTHGAERRSEVTQQHANVRTNGAFDVKRPDRGVVSGDECERVDGDVARLALYLHALTGQLVQASPTDLDGRDHRGDLLLDAEHGTGRGGHQLVTDRGHRAAPARRSGGVPSASRESVATPSWTVPR